MSLFEGKDLACVRGERRVFEGLDFALPSGGVLLLTGANGSGKSSLLRVMAGFLRPARGALFWAGSPVDDDPDTQRGRLHYIGHLDAVKPVLNARENLAFWAALYGGGVGDVERALDGFDLTALARVPGRMLSAGQKRRVALARLLAVPADLWLLDEPTVGLDSRSVDRLTQGVAAHRSAGGCAVIATHTEIALPDAAVLELDRFAPALQESFAAWGAEA